MGAPVTIDIVANTQQATAAMANFTVTATTGLNAVNAAAIRAAIAANNIMVVSGKVTGTTTNLAAGMKALRPVLAVLGFQTFPQLTGAITLTTTAMRHLQTDTGLTTAQLTRLGVIGAVAAGAAYAVQKSFESLWEAELKLSETQGAETQQKQLLDLVRRLGEAGEITGKQFRDLFKQLSGTPSSDALDAIRARLRTIIAEQPTAEDLLRSQLQGAVNRGATLQSSSDTFASRGLAASGEGAINANLLQQAELWRDINAALAERQDKLRKNLELTDAEMVKNKDWLALERDREDTIAHEMALRRDVRDREKAINAQRLDGTRTMFADMATAAQAFGSKGMAAYKAFATAAALMDTYRGATAAYAAMASIPYVGPALGVAAAAAAIAAGLANIAQINSASYESGGYTGDGGRSQVAGIVHGQEWVMPASTVNAWGHANMAAIQAGPRAAASAGQNQEPTFHLFFYDSQAKMRDFALSNANRKIVMHHVNESFHELGLDT